jgi:sarcosine oxidase subunit beta
VRQGAAVTSVLAARGRVTGVRLADGSEVAAPVVVVAAGWWSAALLAPLGVEVPLRVQREEVLVFDAPGRPDVPVLSDLSLLQYVRPEGAGGLLWGNSDMARAQWLDAVDGFSNTVGQATVEDAVERFSARFPGLDDVGLAATYAGCYDVTPDYNPVISGAPLDGLFVAAGFSGHGYKISPAVGDLMADLVVSGVSRDPLVDAADFRLARFAEGALLRSANPYATAGSMR